MKVNMGILESLKWENKFLRIHIIDDIYSVCKIIGFSPDGYIVIKSYWDGGSYKVIINTRHISHIVKSSESAIKDCKNGMWNRAIKYIDKNTPELTEEEKEKKRGRISIAKHTDAAGGLSLHETIL